MAPAVALFGQARCCSPSHHGIRTRRDRSRRERRMPPSNHQSGTLDFLQAPKTTDGKITEIDIEKIVKRIILKVANESKCFPK